jgi:uncharacterized membrane protein
MNSIEKTWHQNDLDTRTVGDRMADWVVTTLGSWQYILIQSVVVVAWIIINLLAYKFRWDPYPFILLNLLFSTQASYAAPIIMMSQNRAADRDRAQATADYETNIRAKEEIEELQRRLARIEDDKLNRILKILEEK